MHTQRDRLGGRERAEKKGRLAGVEAEGGAGEQFAGAPQPQRTTFVCI